MALIVIVRPRNDRLALIGKVVYIKLILERVH